MAKTDLEQFIIDEVEKEKGVFVPIRAGLPERLLVRKLSCRKLHPNPEDEFCFPDIGPNLEIISRYVAQFKENLDKNLPLMDEPLIVQKIRPSGYMLLNGHHRWAAALRLGIKKVPVSVVNAIFESDIRVMLENSTHTKRATIDLDEVIFKNPKDPDVEKIPGLFGFGLHKKRLRRGTPALISYLKKKGYDVWVYSHKFYSIDDIQRYFRRYSAGVDGVITGAGKMKAEDIIADKYNLTLHIDNDLLLVTHSRSQEFEEIEIKCDPHDWSREVIAAVDTIKTDEEKE